jgi:hypothetical protein
MTYNYKEKVDNCGYIQKRWTDGGKLHREGGPTWIVCSYDGSVKFKKYYLDGVLHRKDGPAEIYYHTDGSILGEYFVVNNKRLGFEKEGFWILWETLNENERRNPSLLKSLLRYS